MLLIVGIGLLFVSALFGACEAWTWKRRTREWQRTAKASAEIAERMIDIYAPHDDSLLEARVELRRIKEGVAV